MSRELTCLVLAAACVTACTKRNPNVCCETGAECEAVGYESPQPCDVGVCVENSCRDEGCDGPEDCLDPTAPICDTGSCRAALTPCEMAGGRLAFVSNRDGDEDVLVMNADGTAVSVLTMNGVSDRSPAWSATAAQIAFRRQVSGSAYDVFTMNADGTNTKNVTQNPETQDHFAWSRSGASIAFATGILPQYETYLVNTDGSDLSRVGAALANSARPSFSPDGTKIAFWAYSTQDPGGIYALASDGQSGLSLLGSVAAPIRALHWSPDGTQLAYVEGDVGSGEVWTRDASGANPRNLTMSTADETNVIWSPGGEKLVFVRDGEVWSVAPDGTGAVNLTNNAAYDDQPAFSADGTSLFFTSDRDGNREVYRMGHDGANPVNLTRHPADDNTGAWAPCPAD